MTTGIFLLLAFICAIGFIWTKRREKPVNRYRNKRITPSVSVYENKWDGLQNKNDDATDILVSEKKAVRETFTDTEIPVSSQSDVLIVLYLMAGEDQVFEGYELLQALLSSGLRFGKKRIFERHTHKDGRGDVLFYCSSAVAPGTFDLTKMGTVSCPGLSLFFSASAVAEPLSTFDCLLETIDQLVEGLGGQVLDENRAIFTKEKMVKYRQQLRVFENRKNTVDLFG